jgi:hypothetical protein
MRKISVEREGQLVQVELNDQRFSIDESNLDRELCSIGKFIYEYGTLAAETGLRVGRLDAELERLGAVLDAEVRARFLNAGEKATEARVQHAVVLDKQYQAYMQAKLEAEHDQAMMKWAMVALQHKSEGLRALAYRENQSMKADRS